MFLAQLPDNPARQVVAQCADTCRFAGFCKPELKKVQVYRHFSVDRRAGGTRRNNFADITKFACRKNKALTDPDLWRTKSNLADPARCLSAT
jgi:hypothetical protein